MLNWNKVYKYIRGSMALPSTFFEMTDDEIKDWILLTSHVEFSEYFPSIAVNGIDTNDKTYQADEDNTYLLFDPEDLPILGVRNYYWGGTELVATGHPYMPSMSFSNLPEWALSVFKSNMLRPFSYFNYTGKFFRPNKIRVLPKLNGIFAVEYEREQPHDLREIPHDHSRIYMDLALSEIKIKVGTIRSAYGDGQITTPFGDIPLRGDTIKQEGMELRRESIERMKEMSLPGVYVDTY
jgi:hypothetical protein